MGPTSRAAELFRRRARRGGGDTMRPDWIKCIADREWKHHSLCDRYRPCEFMFQSPEHARLSEEQGCYVQPCSKCKRIAVGRGDWWQARETTRRIEATRAIGIAEENGIPSPREVSSRDAVRIEGHRS